MEKLYEIGRAPEGTFVYARAFRHPFTAELAFELAGELVQIGENLGVVGCLIDLRGTTSASTNADKYNFAYDKATGAGLPHHWRYAFLKDQGDQSPEFIKTVMKNAGYMLHIFEDEHEAINWLTGEQSG